MSFPATLSIRVVAVIAAIVLLFAGFYAAQPAFADSAPPNPANPQTPPTPAVDVLPTPQIDGVVWAQTVVGNVDYVVGSFANARPYGSAPGVNTVPRANILAYNVTTGALLSTFSANVNAQVNAIAASPDGSRVYIGGDFTSIDGVAYYRIAAFSTATGAVIPSFKPIMGSSVKAITATNTTVYAGGWFKSINGATRDYLGAINASNGATLPFVANTDYNVLSLAITTDGLRLVVGGEFQHVDGVSSLGLAAVDPTTGAYINWAATKSVQDYGVNAGIDTLYATSQAVYGAGFVWTQSPPTTQGNLEGTFQADPDSGTIIGMEDCHGDTYSVFATLALMWEVGHQHFCSNIGGFPETNPRSYHYLNAYSTVSDSKIKTNIEGGYTNWAGQPALTQQDFWPTFTVGTYTGEGQATWSVAGNADYIVAGGEFPTVNGIRQQGLTRFAIAALAPNKMGPSASALVPTATSTTSGQVKVAWNATYDPDNGYLTYNLYRDAGTTPIYTTNIHSNFYTTPAMGFTDTGLTPGTSHTYKLVASDPFNNSVTSTTAAVTVAGSAPVNQPPVASFTSSVSGLTVSVNGTASKDPDGSIASYAWNFGDGATATTSTASHTYAAAGTYTISLTVTDNKGATNTATASVTATTSTVIAQDLFGRTTTNGWGSANTGGAWTVAGGSTNFSVASGAGSQSTPAGSQLTASLGSVKSTSTDALVTATTSVAPTGGGAFMSDIGRLVGSSDYEARLWISSAGNVQLQLLQSGTTLVVYTVPGLTYTTGKQLSMRVQVFGTSPTTIRARAWAAGTTEPTTWQLSTTDATAALQAAGSVGLRTYLSGSATSTPLVARYSNFVVVPAQ